MIGPLITFAVGVALALLAGGRLERLSEARWRHLPLFWLSLAAPLYFAFGSDGSRRSAVGVVLVVVSNLCLVAFAWINRRTPGLTLVAVGVFLNALVIALNGGMPVSPTAADQVAATQTVGSIKHEALTDRTVLPWLADRVPVGLSGQVWSLGDFLLVTGVGLLGFGLPRRAPSQRSRPAENAWEATA